MLSSNSFLDIITFAQVIRYFDYVITGIFALEVLVKVTVYINTYLFQSLLDLLLLLRLCRKEAGYVGSTDDTKRVN